MNIISKTQQKPVVGKKENQKKFKSKHIIKYELNHQVKLKAIKINKKW